MKKQFLWIIIFILIFVAYGCDGLPAENHKQYRKTVRTDLCQVLLDELEAGCAFFWETANNDLASAGYGLICDRYNTYTDRPGAVASSAAAGFGLSTIPISIENEWISREAGEERAFYTLVTLKNMERVNGFWYHFIDMGSGKRAWDCEVSVIDTAILINGVLVVGEYFGGRVKKLADELYRDVKWNWYYDAAINKFYMGYKPGEGFSGYWDGYAEHLMLFVLAAGSPKYAVPTASYQMLKLTAKMIAATPYYGSFYATHTGSLFTYQFSHAWLDFGRYRDRDGFDWFLNSVNAACAALNYATDNTAYLTLNENSWGLSACDGPDGYVGPYGSPPSAGGAHVVDGTVPAYGAIGSVVFLPAAAMGAAEHYRTFERFWSKYGFKDSYNLDYSANGWFANDIIGIDKGISVLMIENYLSGMIWKIYHENKYVQAGLKNLGFTEEEK
ncbi:MAG: glucoamylase family protein [Bacilli bacterium]|nr:glucoamylase family protein [Bacilli bacterium]